VGSFPDSLSNFSLLPPFIPLLHTYMPEFAGMCDSPDEQQVTHMLHPPFKVGDFVFSQHVAGDRLRKW